MTDKNEKKLAIVIPVWNNWHYTKKALQGLNLLPKDHCIIVVDNASDDETKNLESNGIIDVVRNERNFGFAIACNIGFNRAQELGYEHVMFLNNDIKVVKDFDTWTQPILDECIGDTLVGPTVGCLDENLTFITEAPKIPSKGYFYMSGWNMTATMVAWEKLQIDTPAMNDLPACSGPFTAEFGLAYFEDTDTSLRARELDFNFEIVPVPVKHFGKATSKKMGISRLYQYAKPLFLAKWKDRV